MLFLYCYFIFPSSLDLFQELFRQDLLVASLFRNFLLAERIMRSYDCTPVSYPFLLPCYQHPMWQAWDYALDHIMSQLPDLIEEKATYQVCAHTHTQPICYVYMHSPLRCVLRFDEEVFRYSLASSLVSS